MCIRDRFISTKNGFSVRRARRESAGTRGVFCGVCCSGYGYITPSQKPSCLPAVLIGKRKGYPRIPKAPHSLVISHIGACMLWAGWFGFNAGSAIAADFTAGIALIATQTGSAAGVLGWTFAEWISYGRPSSLGMISGAVAGLVGVTPASGSVSMLGALCIGFVTGGVCFFSSTTLKDVLKYDDSLDAFGIHGVGGIVGALLTGVWCAPGLGGYGFGAMAMEGEEPREITNIGLQLGMQAASVAYTFGWSILGTWISLKVTDLCHGGPIGDIFSLTAVRVSPEDEEEGIDESYFKEQGYNMAYGDLQVGEVVHKSGSFIGASYWLII